jgi:uncharacterized protein (DUF1778 family)
MAAERLALRVNPDFKAKLRAIAKAQNKSLNQVAYNILTAGVLLEDLVDQESQVIIRKAKGYEENQEVIVPMQEILNR